MAGRGAHDAPDRARGRGRGRGRGRTMIWEWESYTPGPDVYDQLWHIRREPVLVTPYISRKDPIADARARILNRQQTESDIIRNYYVVEITRSDGALEKVEVDQSRILQFVSPAELERFENAEFKAEADAEAVALQIEAEETARRRLERNARAVGVGKGSRMMAGLGLDPELRIRGRKGRGRGRGRGRARGNWRGRGGFKALEAGTPNGYGEKMQQEDGGVEEDDIDEIMQDIVAETESEDELAQDGSGLSPNRLRSAFVANSALPVSPVTVLRRPSIVPQDSYSVPETESENATPNFETHSVGSATRQLRLIDLLRIESGTGSERASVDGDSRRSKRQRTGSDSLDLISMADHSERADSSPHLPAQIATTPELHQLHIAHVNGTDSDALEAPIATAAEGQEDDDDTDADGDEHAEEYAVEAILEHYRQDGKRYYLVKWEGYEDSHDWLPEEDLEGASELVREYHRDFRRREKAKARALIKGKGRGKHGS